MRFACEDGSARGFPNGSSKRGSLIGPHVVDLEVASSPRRLTRHGGLELGVAEQALTFFTELRIQRYPMTPLLGRMWALRETLSAYDAAYVALAEALDLPLLTTDRGLGQSGGHQAQIVAPT